MILLFPILGYMLALRWNLMLMIGAGSVLLYVWKRRILKQNEEEEKKLEECVFYMDQLLSCFRRNHKIETALTDILKISDGRLWCIVKRAENRIRLEWQSADCYEKALGVVEAYYNVPLMKRIHWFLIRVENYGGECRRTVDFLTDAVQDWRKNREEEQRQMKEVKDKLSVCVVLSGVIWIFLARLSPGGISLRNHNFYQYVMAGGILSLQFLHGIFFSLGNHKTRRRRKKKTDYEQLWRRLSAHSHGLQHQRIRQRLLREVKQEFPLWMMEMLLRLQTESVAQAIKHSAVTAPEVLKTPLEHMAQEQEKDPVSPDPFRHFMKELNISEVNAMMSGLYAIRNMDNEESKDTIIELLELDERMEETEVRIRTGEKVGLTGFLAAVPMGISVTVMLLNMIFMLSLYLEQFSKGLTL